MKRSTTGLWDLQSANNLEQSGVYQLAAEWGNRLWKYQLNVIAKVLLLLNSYGKYNSPLSYVYVSLLISRNSLYHISRLFVCWCIIYTASIRCHFVRHGGAYSVLLTYAYFNKPANVNEAVFAAIVILSNVCRAWTMYLCMDSLNFVLYAPGASVLMGRYYFVIMNRPIWGRFY